MANLAHEPRAIFHLGKGMACTRTESPGRVPLPSPSPGTGVRHLSASTATDETPAQGTGQGGLRAPAFACPCLPMPVPISFSVCLFVSPTCHHSCLSLHHPISLSLTLPVSLPLALHPPPPRLTPSPAHHILLQPINNFWAIAPGPRWARPLRRRSTAQPLSAPAASSKVQWGFHSPSPRQGVEEAAGKERRRCQGSLAQEKGVTFTSAGTARDGQAPAAPRARDAERATN